MRARIGLVLGVLLTATIATAGCSSQQSPDLPGPAGIGGMRFVTEDGGTSGGGGMNGSGGGAVDCSLAGCGAPPVCGQACGFVCGCCACTVGDRSDAGVCTPQGCYAPAYDGGGPNTDATDGRVQCGVLPTGPCEEGQTYNCSGYVYSFVEVACSCVSLTWACGL